MAFLFVRAGRRGDGRLQFDFAMRNAARRKSSKKGFCCTAAFRQEPQARGTGTGLGGSQGEPRQLDGEIRTAFSI
jgi:hypothetical protein